MDPSSNSVTPVAKPRKAKPGLLKQLRKHKERIHKKIEEEKLP